LQRRSERIGCISFSDKTNNRSSRGSLRVRMRSQTRTAARDVEFDDDDDDEPHVFE
jgi:hypothetical protein